MASLAIEIAILVLREGPGIVEQVFKLLDSDEDITPEQIKALGITKDPSEFFEVKKDE